MSSRTDEAVSAAACDRALAAHARHIESRLNELRRQLDAGAGEHAQLLQLERDILESGLFDEAFYLDQNPDVEAAGVDALRHYLSSGEAEGRLPNAFFSAAQYRALNPSAVPIDANALGHYVRHGAQQGLPPSAWFDAGEYRAANPELPATVPSGFHFVKLGRAAGLPVRRLGVRQPLPAGFREPRIAAYLGVKDEVELMEPALEHLRRIEVDHVVVCDFGSTDGTLAVLNKHSSDWLTVITPDQFAHSGQSQSAWIHAGLANFFEARFDWVLLLDADDFLIPASGTLKDCRAFHAADALLVDRFNVVVSPNGPLLPRELTPGHLDELLLVANAIPNPWYQQLRQPDATWILGRIEHRLLVRRDRMAGLTPGHHDVAGMDVRRARPTDLLVAHVALSTESRFVRKVENIVAHFADLGIDVLGGPDSWQQNPVAWHWRRWAELARQGRLREEYARNVFAPDAISRMKESGAIRSAGDLLRRGDIGPFARSVP